MNVGAAVLGLTMLAMKEPTDDIDKPQPTLVSVVHVKHEDGYQMTTKEMKQNVSKQLGLHEDDVAITIGETDDKGTAVTVTLIGPSETQLTAASERMQAMQDDELGKSLGVTITARQPIVIDRTLPELSFGNLADINRGLTGLVGPRMGGDTASKMRVEHTQCSDSNEAWTTGNYTVASTSSIEFHFVAVGGEVDAESGKPWPLEMRLINDPDKSARNRCRKPRPVASFTAARQQLDTNLAKLCVVLVTETQPGGLVGSCSSYYKTALFLAPVLPMPIA
jgi:hypothetical protein